VNATKTLLDFDIEDLIWKWLSSKHHYKSIFKCGIEKKK
jgi:hypothetical protein